MRSILAVFGAIALAAAALAEEPSKVRRRDYVDYVRPWIGSKTGRWFQTVSGCRPFGMIGITPDTEFGGRGYVYDKTDVYGFSHLHGWGLGAILVMPTTGGVSPAGGPDGWKSAHQHANENNDRRLSQAGLGPLQHHGGGSPAPLGPDTTAGRSAATAWPTSSSICIPCWGGTDQTDARVTKVGDREIEGWVHMHANGGSGYEGESRDVGRVYFVARFNKPLPRFGPGRKQTWGLSVRRPAIRWWSIRNFRLIAVTCC